VFNINRLIEVIVSGIKSFRKFLISTPALKMNLLTWLLTYSPLAAWLSG